MDIELDEKIVNEILRQRPELSIEDIKKMVYEKIVKLSMSSKTALYLVSLELGVRLDSKVPNFLEIGKLRSGLSKVRVIGRILWLRNEEYFNSPVYGKRPYVRGGIGDKTGVANIIFWGFTRKNLEDMGVEPGVVVDIFGASTKTNLFGEVELHVSELAKITVSHEKETEYPKLMDFISRIDQCDFSRERVNVYGKVLSPIQIRKYKLMEREGVIGNFLIASHNKAFRVVLWNKVVDEYSWVKPGDVIVIFNGRVRVSRRGEYEIHINRSSHIEYLPGASIPIKYEKAAINDIENGYNLKSIDARVLAIGKRRKSAKTGNSSLGLYIIDETADATLILLGDELISQFNGKVGDIIRINGFRGIRRLDQIFIFSDSLSKIIVNPSDAKPLPHKQIETKCVRELNITDTVVSIEGKVVKPPTPLSTSSIFEGSKFEFVIEDENGEPINVIYGGDIHSYTDEDFKVGDKIRIEAGFLDASSLIGSFKVPIIKLRAYSRIYVL